MAPNRKKERNEIMKKVYVYMSEDNIYGLINTLNADNSRCIPFKAGFSSDPKRRGYQLKGDARKKGIMQEIQMCVRDKYIEVPWAMRFIVEGYILHRIRLMPSATVIKGEYVMISIADRQYCYDHMAEWVEEALRAKAL